MEQSHPPYVSGALTIPRQLERWLDVNPQNGPLRRTQKYVTVPAFDIEHEWNGYSEVVGEYHFEAPNNFSLKIPHDGDTISIETNYTLCVSYVNSDNTVVRYSLIRGEGDLFYGQLEPYAGQLIKKNFRIEIWNTSQVTCSEIYSTNIYTSVLGDQDYRYGTDSQLKQADPLCTGQQSTDITVTTPPTTSLQVWLDPRSNANLSEWIDRYNNITFTGNDSNFTFFVPNIGVIGNAQEFVSTAVDTPQDFYFHFYYISPLTLVEILLSVTDIHTFEVSMYAPIPGTEPYSIQVLVNDTDSVEVSGLYASQEYIVHVSTSAAGGTIVELYRASDLLLISSNAIPQGLDFGAGSTVNIGNSFNGINTNISTRSILIYSDVLSDELKQPVIDFMGSTLSSEQAMTLPLTWGLCAQPTLNT